jgi:predicted kinase
MVMDKEFFMMVGPPCSGKDTFIKKTFSSLYNIISLDDIIDEAAKVLGATYSEIFQHVSKFAERELNRKIPLMFDGSGVIWNQTNMSAKSRVKKLSRVPKDYKKICVVIVWPSEEILLERNKKRNFETGKYIPDSVIESMIDSYDIPTFDEGWDQIWYVGLDGEVTRFYAPEEVNE